jgi:biopolymer transport protein ExbD
MSRSTIARMPDQHVNVTPLIDVVMCLIIFFLLVGQMAKDQMPAMNLPRAGMGTDTSGDNQLVVNLIRGVSAGHEAQPPQILVRNVVVPGDRLEDVLRMEKARNSGMSVTLRADSGIDYQYVGPVLTSCAEAGVRRVNFAAVKR